VTELLACLIADKLRLFGAGHSEAGVQGLRAFSFGQKKTSSAVATARLVSIVQPFEALAMDTRAVDVAMPPLAAGRLRR
jgi:hypothetical protein